MPANREKGAIRAKRIRTRPSLGKQETVQIKHSHPAGRVYRYVLCQTGKRRRVFRQKLGVSFLVSWGLV